MAADAVYTEQLMDAVIQELSEHLPSGWTGPATGEEPAKVAQPGDLFDFPAVDPVDMELPAIFVKPLGINPVNDHGGIGGVDVYAHGFRLVHVRAHEQCYDGAGARETNMARARARYAKALHYALNYDRYGLMDSPTLTATGGTARVINVVFDSWDLGRGTVEDVAAIRDLRAGLWAIACDFEIWVNVTPT